MIIKDILTAISEKAAAATPVGVGFPGQPADKQYDYITYIQDLYTFALRLGIALATLIIIYAGYRYIFSQGKESDLSEAKEYLFGAILGLIILYLVKLLLDIMAVPHNFIST